MHNYLVRHGGPVTGAILRGLSAVALHASDLASDIGYQIARLAGDVDPAHEDMPVALRVAGMAVCGVEPADVRETMGNEVTA